MMVRRKKTEREEGVEVVDDVEKKNRFVFFFNQLPSPENNRALLMPFRQPPRMLCRLGYPVVPRRKRREGVCSVRNVVISVVSGHRWPIEPNYGRALHRNAANFDPEGPG